MNILPHITLLALLFSACQKEVHQTPIKEKAQQSVVGKDGSPLDQSYLLSGTSAWISISTANDLIGSYLNSIDSHTPTQLQSLWITADDLRAYLADTAITKIKMSFAHTPTQVSTAPNAYCGLKAGSITLVLTGVDASGDYKLYAGGLVLDNLLGCPHNCPITGTAAQALIDTLH